MKIKRILFVIPSLHPGGAEYQTVNQVNHLHSKNFSTDLLILTDRIDLLSLIKLPSEKIHILGVSGLSPLSSASIKKTPKTIRLLQKSLMNIKPDVVLAILPISHYLLRIYKLKHKGTFRLWCYHRSMQYQANPLNTISKQAFNLISYHLSKRFDFGHLFISEAVKQDISDHLPVKNGFVIHNAIPIRNIDKKLALSDLRKRNKGKSDYVVVIPGRLHPVKGHLFLLETLKDLISGQAPDQFQLIILGGGELEGRIRDFLRRNQIEDRVLMTGFVENIQILSYLKLADLVCIPSINEGFGNVAIEALMQGSTVLASNAGGLPEIIEHEFTGFLFEKENKKDLLAKFSNIYFNKRKIDSDILINSFKSRFTLEKQIEKLLKITLPETS